MAPTWPMAVVGLLLVASACDGSSPASAPSTRADSPRSTGPRVVLEHRGPQPSDGMPRRATVRIPRIGLAGLVVEPYRGRPDDAPGTRLQDRGLGASPHGPRGGTGPGGVGNYLVTAHRTSSTRAFARLPELRRGDRVVVEAAGVRYVYEIRLTRSTSFRSDRSRARQEAAVPGRPGAAPTRAMVTLSTCATQEDHTAGNYWSDEFHNPEHRIDKVGVLVASGPVRRRSPATRR
ncbi:sortase domain-containing protein [Nocardioides sp. Soil796]|uniref:sortase domain-containing protein n=1 Tax=Nocardioides sp. Soil796 TaxID=1736412 RepID=UPI001F17E786|nr:sortase [Nocardioides sp. Soil796]